MLFDAYLHKMYISLGVLFCTFYLLEGEKYRMKVTKPDGKREIPFMYVNLTLLFPREDCKTLFSPL